MLNDLLGPALSSAIRQQRQQVELMKELSLEDQRFVDAAMGWLGLGDVVEANEELERVTPKMRIHPVVLRARYDVYSMANKWEPAADVARTLARLVPAASLGWINWAFALHKMKRTEEAWNVLLPVARNFPKDYMIPYNLACYACQMGRLKDAWKWLEKAIDLSLTKDVRLRALDDPDLEPLWKNIAEI